MLYQVTNNMMTKPTTVYWVRFMQLFEFHLRPNGNRKHPVLTLAKLLEDLYGEYLRSGKTLQYEQGISNVKNASMYLLHALSSHNHTKPRWLKASTQFLL